MELLNDASACTKRLAAALRERRLGKHRWRLALPEYGRMGVAQHQMTPLLDFHQTNTDVKRACSTVLAVAPRPVAPRPGTSVAGLFAKQLIF
jgi:hypothetical protein